MEFVIKNGCLSINIVLKVRPSVRDVWKANLNSGICLTTCFYFFTDCPVLILSVMFSLFISILMTYLRSLKNKNNYASSIQNGARWLLWVWFQIHFWITENSSFLWIISNSRTPPAIFKTISASSFQLQPCSFNSLPLPPPLCNYVIMSDPNHYLLNKYPYFLPAPNLILDNLCNLVRIFAYTNLPHFVTE